MKVNSNCFRRLLALILALSMTMSLLSANVWAADLSEEASDPGLAVQSEQVSDDASDEQSAPPAEESEEEADESAEKQSEVKSDRPAEDESEPAEEHPEQKPDQPAEDESQTEPESSGTAALEVQSEKKRAPAFEQSRTVDGVKVTVSAPKGVFPAGTSLKVEKAVKKDRKAVKKAVNKVRSENENVVARYTFDIKVVDPVTGEEYQPAEGQTVSVSFSAAEVADKNLETQVYHFNEGAAEKLEVTGEKKNTATVETDGFSLYTVEFTYNNLQYVMQGDTSAALSDILAAVGLTGEATAVSVSDSSLFSAAKNDSGKWVVTAHKAFSTTEWMKVTINGVVYEIAVTDDASYSATFSYNGKTYSAGGITGTQEIQLSTILTPLEINGTVTAASVSEGQGMTVTTEKLTLTKAFGTGWLKVTAGGTEHQITITSTPDSISVVLYGTLFFDKNGGSGIMDGQSVREYSTTVLPVCTFTPPDGYEFDQWEINGARYNAGAAFTFGQTTTAKAIWKLREGVHSITADYNNSDGDVVVSPTMAAADKTVTVTVQPVAGKAVDSISYSYGSTTGQALSGGEGGVYTFSMPGENTTVSVTFKDAAKTPISYVDENGSSHSCNDYNYVRPADTTWSGWVVASQNLTLGNRVTVSDTVNLILMDGKTLTVTNGIQVGEGSTLNIYAQSGNTGALIAGNKQLASFTAGIGGDKDNCDAGTITINGGKITAVGGYGGAGIGGGTNWGSKYGKAGSIAIRGNADVTVTGGENGAGIGSSYMGKGGSIAISGNATVYANAVDGYGGSGVAIGGGRGGYVDSITISGGTVVATGGNQGSAIGGTGGTISITGGNVTATATGSSGAGIGGQCTSITIGGSAVVNATGASRGAGIGGCYQNPGGKITIADNANVTAVGGAYAAGIGTGYNAVADGETAISITGGTVNASIASSYGAAAIGSGNNARGKTTISISNGSVTASGSSIYGVGIGGGNSGVSGEEVVVNITGGTVNASGRAGIGTASNSNAKQTINISGGMVTARGAIDGSNKCAAIGQGNNSNSVTEINITGGIVRALGTGTGIGSGANSKQTPAIKLGYTDETKNGMEITAIDYNGTVTLNNNFKYQDSAAAVTAPITANKTIVPSDSTAHTHSFTYSVDGKTITAICANSDNRCNLTDHKATLTIGEPDGKTSMVYDGTAKAAVLTGNTDVLTADVVYKKGNTVLPAAPSDAGSYTAGISLGEVTATVSYEITRKPVTFASITANDKVYDGTTKASCSIGTGVNGAVSGDSVSANVSSGVANFDTPDVGLNKAVTFTNWTLQGSSMDNYEMVQPEPQYRTITPRVITITAKAQTVQQGGTVTSTPEQVEVTGGTLVEEQRISEITLTGDTSAVTTSGTVTPSAVKILDASNNDVTANYAVNYTAGTLTVTEAPHTHSFTYSASGAAITATCGVNGCPLTNRQATLTIEAPTELTYDGAAKAAKITGDTTVLGTPIITYTKTGDTSFTGTPKAAGTYNASITLGTGDNTATASVNYTIEPKSVTITGLSASNKEYDGTTTATVTGTATIDGKVDSDDVTVTAGAAAFADANVGTGKTVTFSGYSLSGSAAGNYTLSAQPANVTANITARPITVTAADQSVELNGEIATGTDKVSVTSGSLVDGHRLTSVTLTPSSTANTTTSGTITPSDIVVKDADNNDVTSNYAITPANGVLTVTKIKAKVTTAPTANNRTYDGTTKDLLTGGAADTSLEYSTNGTTFSATIPQGKDVDSYTVYYRAAADGNHEASNAVTLTVTISKVPLTVTAKDQSYTYNNAAQGENNATYTTGIADKVTVEGLQGSDALTSITLNGTETNAGEYSGKIVPSAAAVGTATGNYEITYTNGKLTIKQKAITITGATATGRDYAAGNKVVTISAVTFNSATLTLGTDYTVTGEMADDTAGSDKNVAVTVTLTNSNYSLDTSTMTTTVTINKIAHDNATASGSAKYGNSGTVDLSALIEAGGSLGDVSVTDTNSVLDGTPTIVTGNQLSFKFKNETGNANKTATVTIPVTGATNYNNYNIVATLTVMNKPVPTLTVSNFTKTYDGNAVTLDQLTKTAKDGSTDVEGTWSFDGTPGLTNVSDSGEKTVRFTPSDPANYESATAAFTLTINPISVEIPTAATGLKWTGNEQTGVAGGEGYTVTDGAKTDAGSYTATATLNSTNYKWSDNTTAAKNIPWSIAKADGPAAPTELVGVAPTSENGNDGKIIGVTTAMEYATKADFSDKADCSGTETTGLTAGTYYVRVKETATHEAGTAATVSVPAYVAPTYDVTITAGAGMTKTDGSGTATQTDLSGAITDVVYTADEGYYFPTDYSVEAVNGISVTRDSYTQITVSGTPTADAAITLTAPTAKTKPDAPTTAAAVNCTTAGNNDGKLTGVTTAMEYKKSNATDWTAGTGSDITGLVPGTYYVRLKATDTSLASDNQELTIAGYVAPTYKVTYKVVNGTWSDDSTAGKKETVQSGSKPASVPTGMKASSGYTGGAWDTDPADATITGATTFTYTFTAKQAAIVKKAPTAKTLTYNGSAQELVTAGEAEGGTMYYAVTTENTAPMDDNLYTTSIPTKTNAGSYYVWYKVKADANHSDTEAKSVSVTIRAPAPTGGGTTPTTETITIPVSSEDGKTSVNVTVTVSGSTATVTSADVDKVLGAKDVGNVTVDVTNLNKVDEVVLPAALVEKVAKAVADKKNDASGLEIKLPTGTVTFDATTVAALAQQSNGKDLKVHLDKVSQATLTNAQQNAIKDLNTLVVLDAYVTADGKRISDFKGGTATFSVPVELKNGQSAKGVVVFYVDEKGNLSEIPCTCDGETATGTVEHFSNYVVAYDVAKAEKAAEDAKAVEDAVKTLDALPAADDVKLEDKEAIEKARAAYDALTDEQKAKVDPAALKKLTDAEAALKALNPEPQPEPGKVSYDDLSDAEKQQADEIASAWNVDKDTAAQMLRLADELGVSLDTLLLTGDALAKMDVDSSDPKGTDFGKLRARATKRTNSALTLKWTKQKNADGYLIYGNKCGKKFKMKLIKAIKKNKTVSFTQKKLKKGTYYKYMVVAYKNVNGQKMPIAASVVLHAPTKGGNVTVAKSVKVTQGKKNKAVSKLTLKKGKSVTVNATEVKEEKKLKLKTHRVVKFESSNKKIATVNAKGKVTGKKKGKATIYAYAQNGIFAKITVTVK